MDGHSTASAEQPRGVALVDDQRVISGIFYILRTGAPWRDLPERYGPPSDKTDYLTPI